jgi:hypothetical protein
MLALGGQDIPGEMWTKIFDIMHFDLKRDPAALLSVLVVNKYFNVGLFGPYTCLLSRNSFSSSS